MAAKRTPFTPKPKEPVKFSDGVIARVGAYAWYWDDYNEPATLESQKIVSIETGFEVFRFDGSRRIKWCLPEYACSSEAAAKLKQPAPVGKQEEAQNPRVKEPREPHEGDAAI